MLGACLLIAGIGAAGMGQASCEEAGDPLRGSCEQYADDGFTPTTDQVLERFFYIFFTLLAASTHGLFKGDDVWKRRSSEGRFNTD